LFSAVSLAILLTLAAPVLDLQLGSSGAGGNPTSRTSRRAYDLLAEGFGVGFNGPVLVGVAIDDPNASQLVDQLPDLIKGQGSVASVSPPRFNDARTAGTINVIPATAPQDEETKQLIQRLRDIVPWTLEGSGVRAFVGGPTAVFIDVGDRIESRMPTFFLAVIGLSFVLLMAVFRSIVVPVKAALMNVLSIGAAYGVLVAVFQWGWFAGPLGVPSTGPIESFLPMMLFAVLFGLSMDYEVFLVSRIQEEYLRTGNNTDAVARGLSVTMRVISAAAAIMVAVFLAFVAGDQRIVKEFGVGLATAIFVDATLVRLVLVPSMMQLVGNANWWFPRWLDRLLPHIGIHPPAPRAERQGGTPHMRNLYTNHGLLLMRIWIDPDATLSQIATEIGVKEQAVYLIVDELVREGFIVKEKAGRRNRYFVNIDKALNFQPIPNTTIREQIVGLALTMGMRLPEDSPLAQRPVS